MRPSVNFDSAQAAAISGLGRHMVDYLSRSEIVKPTVLHGPGRGRRRRYSFGDLVTLRAVATLLAAGISVKKLKLGIAVLQKKYGRQFKNTPADYFWTDGADVYFRSKDQLAQNISKGGQQVFGFMLNLDQLHKETTKAIKRANAA